MNFNESQKQMIWSNPSTIVYDKKLDTALRPTSVRMLKRVVLEEDPRNYNFDIRLLLKNNKKDDIEHMQTNNSCYGYILHSILYESRKGNLMFPKTGKKLSKSYELAKRNLMFQHYYSTSSNNLPSKPLMNRSMVEKMNNMNPTPEIMNLMCAADEFRKIIDLTAFTKRRLGNDLSDSEKIDELSKSSKRFIPQLDISVSWSIHHCVINLSSGYDYILPICYLLLIHNKLCDLLSVLILIQYQSGVCHESDAYNIVVRFVTEMTRLCCKHKDKFANISGSIEGMVIGEILLETEEWENCDLLDNIQEDLLESICFDYFHSELRQLILSASIPLRNELGCLSKLLGHPFVDMEKGAKKLHKRTTAVKELTYESVSWVVNKAKETFVKNYIARHNRWPPCFIHMHYPGRDALLNAQMRNLDPSHPSILDKYGTVDIQDWSRVEFDKIMEFQELENIIPFLKDKSISVFRNQAVQSFLRHPRTRSYRWEDTRLLLYYLLNPLQKLDHQLYLKKYTDAKDLDELADYLIIRLVPKEKEHKIEFRGFGVKTYHDRLRSLAQEKNVAKFLDLYCDEQAMTLSELDISKRLYAYRTILKAYRGYKVLYVNFDSSGWNNCFRDETVKPVIRETLSQIFGNNVLDRIHEAYQKSLYIIPDGDSTYFWEGQQGGIDGLNQYAWVWVYVNQIKYAMKDLPVKYHMLCKGDDMRLAVLIHPSMLRIHDMKYYHELIVHRVETVAKEFGHEIKVQESYGSEKYFTFSKSASLGPVELPQGFRKIQKVYGANNALIAVLDEYIASSFSNAHSACRCMTNTYSAYFVALVWSYWQLTNLDTFSNLTDDQICAALLIPNMLGGFPIIYLHNMRIRAESDLLSPFIHMIQYAETHDGGLARVLIRFLTCRKPNKPNFTRLYRDPYSLNIMTPPLPVSVLRSMILPQLRRKVRNQDIRDLIRAAASPENKMIIKTLESARPQDAKVMATIYSATPEGIQGELLRKFESGRSILDLLLLRNKKARVEKQLKRVLDTEVRLQKWRADKLKGVRKIRERPLIDSYDMVQCPSQLAQKLRDETWGTPITGISMPPLQHQIVLHRPVDIHNSTHARNNHFLYEYEVPTIAIDPNTSPHWMAGTKNPFLGYTTRTGNIAPTVSFQDKDPLIVKVKNILDLFSWVRKSSTDASGYVKTSNLDLLLKMVLNMYTNITAEEMAPFTACRKSGTIQHHARAPRFKESIVPNILSNMYQNVTGKSDSHVTLTSSSLHYRINFLHVMCETIHQMHMELEVCDTITTPRVVWAITSECTYCLKPIEEEPIMIDDSMLPMMHTSILNACRLENISKDLILKSYTDFSEVKFKLYNTDDQPDEELSSVAVVTDFVMHGFKTHGTLQSRFTQHALTAEGHNTLVNLTHKTMSRDIGLTELKRMKNDIILQSLAYPVFEFIQHKVGLKDQNHVLAELQKIHSYELPWYSLLDKLQMCRKLGDLISIVGKISGVKPPACFENPAASAPYIGHCVYKMVLDGRLPLRLAIRTYMSKEQALSELNYLVLPYKWHLIKEYFFDPVSSWRPGTDEPELRYLICLRALYICLMDVNSEELIDHVSNNIPPNQLNPVDISGFLEIEGDYMVPTLEDEHDPRRKMAYWLMDKFPSWPWQKATDNILEGDVNDAISGQVSRFAKRLLITIGFCDIASAIEVVRSNDIFPMDTEQVLIEKLSSSDEDQNPPMGKAVTIECYGVKKRSHANVFSWGNCRTGRQHGDNQFINNEYDYTYDKILFDEAHGLRLYGSQTTSQSKLDYILTITHTQKYLPHFVTILCTADGYGGFVEYLSHITEDSVFVFNTLLTTPGRLCLPYSAIPALTKNNNKVDITLLDQGLDDLSQEVVVEHLISSGKLYSVVTCDADIHWDDRLSSEKILHNITTIFLKSSLPDALFVCKANMAYSTVIVDICSVLRMYCRKVYVVRCPQSNMGGEVYIVAHGLDRQCINDPCFLNASNDEERRLFQVFVQHLYNEFIRRQAMYQYNIQPPLYRGLRVLYDDLECAATSKLYSRIALEFDVKDEIQKCKYIETIRSTCIKKIGDQLDYLIDIMNNTKKHAISGTPYEQTTLTHRLIAAMRVITCEGCMWMLCTWTTKTQITRTEMKLKYNNILSRMSPNLGLFPPKTSWYKTSGSIHNVKMLAPYQRFMDGIRLGQMIIGYIIHSRLSYKPKSLLTGGIYDDA